MKAGQVLIEFDIRPNRGKYTVTWQHVFPRVLADEDATDMLPK